MNLLPYDGTVFYFQKIFCQIDSEKIFETLLNSIDWKNDEAFIYGKHIITKRKVAWYGDENYEYKYSKTSKFALPWTSDLIEIKNIVEKCTNNSYNSCLLNLYHTGDEGMTWHSDDEETMKKNGSIASVSFGALRKFSFKRKQSKEVLSLELETGSILEMKDNTQTHWLHALPKTKKVLMPRINLTFRSFTV
jgi:alkylated DNA repair dioxygenase AlkB